MNAEVLLSVIVSLAGFVLKTTLAFAACLAFCRLLPAAKLRFLVWCGLVYGAAAYWVWLAVDLAAAPQRATSAATGLLPPASPWVGSWQIAQSFAVPIGFALRVAGVVYLLTLGYLIVAYVKRRRHLGWVLSFCCNPPETMAENFSLLARELHASRAKLLILSGVTSPATFGWMQPTVVLPPSCVEEDPRVLEDILRHELQHVRRWDAFWNSLAIASRGLLFFHPAVRYAVGKMHVERELACDLAVVTQSPARRADYAECLLRFARLNVLPDTDRWGIDFAASENHLRLRIHSILAAQKRRSLWLRGVQFGAGLTIIALFLGALPSLAVLVTFTQPLLQKTSLTPVDNGHALGLHAVARPSRNARPSVSSASVGRDAQNTTPAVASQQDRDQVATDLQTGLNVAITSGSSNAFPQLLHRGDAPTRARQGATSQSIALATPEAVVANSKAASRKQALQQTATAALGIYKQVSAVDRH